MKRLYYWMSGRRPGSVLIGMLFGALVFSWINTVETAQAAGSYWVLKETKFGADTSTYWTESFLGSYTEKTVTLAASQHTVQVKVTKGGQVTMNARFFFDFDTPPAKLTPGSNLSLQVTGSSQGPYGNGEETFYFTADTWTNGGQKISPVGITTIKLDDSHPSGSSALQFSVPATFDGQLIIKSQVSIGAQFHVQWIYKPVQEGFVITNTSTCQTAAGDMTVLRDAGTCEVKHNGVTLQQNSSTPAKVSDLIEAKSNTSVAINYDCITGLATFLELLYFDGSTAFDKSLDILGLAFLVLGNDPSLCQPVSSIADAGGSNRIRLDLQSGAARFKPKLADLALDIETDTATVRSTARNDFVVGHDPDTDLTVVICAQGRVTVDPVNPNLSSVTLETGQQVKVTANSIGPITLNPLNSFLPVIMR
jgi:hypothetical protein